MNSIGDNLKRIRLLKSLSLKKAGEMLNMSATAISKYEKGEILPSSAKIIEFANTYNVKALDIIKTYKTPEMKFTSFRKKKRLTGQKFELLEKEIKIEISKYLEVKELNNLNTSDIKLKKYFCKTEEDAENAAREFRDYMKMSNKQPLPELINILENLGITIVQIKDKNNMFSDFDGLSEIINKIPIIVVLDNIADGARQRFTIAHELGHLLLDISGSKTDEEKLCNRFASALLMPKEAVINEFGLLRKNISFYELDAFKKEYKVSYTAIIYRLKDLDIISEYLYKKLSIYLSQRIGKNDRDPIEPEISYEYKKTVYKLEADEIISVNKACELLGVTEDEYNSENYSY